MSSEEQRDDLGVARLRPVLFDLWLPRGPELSWQVVSLRGTEALAQPFEFEVELWCDDPEADFEQALGADCELLLERNGLERQIYGIIAEIEILFAAELRIERDGIGARVKIVPAFRLLEQEVDTRFFSGQTAIEILAEILGSRLGAYERSLDVESRITGEYNRRDYCVQFRESTFDFCSRIMEEEGIAYLFVPDPDDQRERMILIDNNEAYASAELLIAEPMVVERDRPEELDRESIQAFHWRHKRVSNRVLTRGYNYKLVNPVDEGEAEDLGEPQPLVRERVVEASHRQIIDDPRGDPEATSFDGSSLAQQVPLARRVLEAQRVEAAIGRGQSNAVGFAAGVVFELERPPVAGTRAQRFLLTRVEHRGRVSEGAESTNYAYENHFECLADNQVYRPARKTKKPRVHGVQTGIVVGKAPDEVHTDPLGRVQVAFSLHGRADERSSCWIRVAQVWAGPGYGAMVIPRVGMEVVVAFVDGDPDRPLITGCVYNGKNSPPYELPSELSKSTFKTSSTPGGEAFSEIRFEDAAGSEQVFVRAQRRMDLRVQGSLFATCTGGREEIVGSELDNSESMHNLTVWGEANTVYKQDHLLEVMGHAHVSYDKSLTEFHIQRRIIWVNDFFQLTAPTIINEAIDTISQKADHIRATGSHTMNLKAGETLVLESNNAIELRVGKSFISINQTGIDISGYTLRLNSGGGAGSAKDALPAKEFEIIEPLDALPADDGRIHAKGTGGGGRGRRREHKRRKVEPHRAPDIVPPAPVPKPKDPREDIPTSGAWLSMAWKQREVWCSEEATLLFEANETTQGMETAYIQNVKDGAVVGGVGVTPCDGLFERSFELCDVLPQPLPVGVEESRELTAWLTVGLFASNSITLRFISELPRITWTKGFAHFVLRVRDHTVEISSNIPYKRGRMGYLISLGDAAPEDARGIVGAKLNGVHDWRFCKKIAADQLLYWDGKGWQDVPKVWTDPLGTKLIGIGLWKEDGKAKTQYDIFARWPEELPEWSEESIARLEEVEKRWIKAINEYWSSAFDIKRDQCHGHDPKCCRYSVKCYVDFFEIDHKAEEGIVISENHARANAHAWPMRSDPFAPGDIDRMAIHEFGHHLGNPDEYEGASTVDVSVNGDGAKLGIDDHSIMGKGGLRRRRHFNAVIAALTQRVADETGKPYTYSAVEIVK